MIFLESTLPISRRNKIANLSTDIFQIIIYYLSFVNDMESLFIAVSRIIHHEVDLSIVK